MNWKNYGVDSLLHLTALQPVFSYWTGKTTSESLGLLRLNLEDARWCNQYD